MGEQEEAQQILQTIINTRKAKRYNNDKIYGEEIELQGVDPQSIDKNILLCSSSSHEWAMRTTDNALFGVLSYLAGNEELATNIYSTIEDHIGQYKILEMQMYSGIYKTLRKTNLINDARTGFLPELMTDSNASLMILGNLIGKNEQSKIMEKELRELIGIDRETGLYRMGKRFDHYNLPFPNLLMSIMHSSQLSHENT